MRYSLWGLVLIGALVVAPASSASAQSVMKLDQPVNGEVLVQPIQFSGWALDLGAKVDTGVDAVEIWAYSLSEQDIRMTFIADAKYGLFREDVVKEFGWQFQYAGFDVSVAGLSPGGYTFIVRARNAETGSFDQSLRTTVWIAGGPEASIDGPVDQSSVDSTFTIWGWALDASSMKDTGVDAIQVWAFPTYGFREEPIFLGDATYGLFREDVASRFGKRFAASGYSLEVSSKLIGAFEIVVLARSTATGEFDQAKAVTVFIGTKGKVLSGRLVR
jgi:hypothetical protein